MPRLEEVYLSKEELPELEKEFYKNYDESYWNVKIGMYDYLIENMKDIFENADDEEIEDYQRMAKAEFVYMFYHSTEALLGLVMSLTRNGTPWIDLKEARGWKIDDFVDEDLRSDDFDEELHEVFYPGVRPDEDQRKQINESVGVVRSYLKQIGSMFDDRDVYNEYKHGLRLVTQESRIEMEFNVDESERYDVSELDNVEELDDGRLRWTVLNGDILFYLEPSVWGRDKDSGKKFWSLARKMQTLEFELYRRLCSFNADLIAQVFSVRRDILDLDDGEREMSTMKLWDDVDLQELFKPKSPLQGFSVGWYHPRSEDDVLEYEVR